MCRCQADGGRRCQFTRATTAHRRKAANRLRMARGRGSATYGQALTDMIAGDPDPATLAAGLRAAESSDIAAALASTSRDPEVLAALASSRWPAAVPPTLRVACAARLDQWYAENAAADRAAVAGLTRAATGATINPEALKVVAGEVLRQSPAVLLAVAEKWLRTGEHRLAAVALTAPGFPAADRVRIAVEFGRAANKVGSAKWTALREAVLPAVTHLAASGQQIGPADVTATRTVIEMLPSKLRGQAVERFTADQAKQRADHRELATTLGKLADGDVWIATGPGVAARAAAWGGESGVQARWQGAWARARECDRSAAEAIRAGHVHAHATWGDSRKREQGRVDAVMFDPAAAGASA